MSPLVNCFELLNLSSALGLAAPIVHNALPWGRCARHRGGFRGVEVDGLMRHVRSMRMKSPPADDRFR